MEGAGEGEARRDFRLCNAIIFQFQQIVFIEISRACFAVQLFYKENPCIFSMHGS